ncbi:DNAH7 [Symbiodinium necroappetens]|uniref:DNAH7 protein n=1 Tax=Symbiodinium necroappetens TaxID=1628268 RepID=A0A813C957_9DINO|nr:DNAH7 [Symbiodinium necroappetens]
MARLPSRGKKLAAAAARGAGPASKLQPAKVGKAAALVAPACPPGCAVVSADLLHHLQQEVGVKATAPHEPKYEARHELNSRPEPSKAQARPKRQKDPGSQEVLPLKAAAVLHDEVPPPPGAHHAGVGTVQAVEEGTQTSFEENKAGAPPPRPQAAPQAGPLPTSAREGIEMRPTLNVNRHRVDGVTEATPLQHDGMLAPRQAAVAAPAAVAQPQPVETSQNYGRCDPFHLDRITAEKERDRKRVQAQMLAEQIQEPKFQGSGNRRQITDIYHANHEVWKKAWLGVSFREPQPGTKQFEVKAPNTVIVITPNIFKNDVVREAYEAAATTKKNVVFLHHIASGCNLNEEAEQAPEELKKSVDKIFKDKRYVIYTEDLSEECNDMLMEKLNLRNADEMKAAYEKRAFRRNIDIMKYSAKVAKARTQAGVKRKYDLCITAANVEHSPDGMPVVDRLFTTMSKLAPALTIGRNYGDKVSNADVRHSFNIVVVLTKDALTCPDLMGELKSALEAEASILIVHDLLSCPDLKAEIEKCEDKVVASSLMRSARFVYMSEVVTSVVLGILSPGTIKTDDAKSPRTKQALSSGGGKQFRLEYKNCFALDLAKDGTGQVYNTKFSDKKKDLPGDIDSAIKALFELYDPAKKGSIGWPQFAEVDRIVTECLGGQYEEMISRRAFSMMNYPGLTLESEISFTTFHNYHAFVAKQMGALEGDRDSSMHYKYIVDKVKNSKKGKRFLKLFDLYIVHDESKESIAFAKALKVSIKDHTPNVRTAVCNEKVPGKEDMQRTQIAAQSLNVLILLQEDCLLKEEVAKDVVAGANEGAQILVLVNMENSPILEKERKKATPEVQTAMSRPPVVEYWKGSDQACCVKLLDLMSFPIDANAKRPLPNKKATFRQKENPVVLFLYQQCEEDAVASQAMTALANLVSPISKSGDLTRAEFLRDGGCDVLQERFSSFLSVAAVAEPAARCVANLAMYPPCARRMAELGTVKTLIEAMQAHVDSPNLQGDACCAIVNIAQDDVGKKKVNELGGFQQMLQSQKRFEYNADFWDMRWGMKELAEGDTVMVNYHGKGRWVTGTITRVNKGNGAYDVDYMHGGNDRKVPTNLVRPKDKSDMIDEFVAVWQWKPEGKLTEDELTLKADGFLFLKREGQAAAGTWNVAEPKGGGRNLVKIKLSVPFSSIEMERISLTTLRSTSGPQRAVLKDSLDDCLYVEYFEFPEGLADFKKPPPLLGRKPDISRSEQQIDWVKTDAPWTGLPANFNTNFAARWKGVVEITKMGDYQLKLEAATSSVLRLNDKVVIDGSGEWQGKLLGGPNRITMDFFSNEASKFVQLSYCGPDTGDEWTIMPVAVLQHEACRHEVVPKPGFIAEYFPEAYEDRVIPGGIDPDIVRTEKQLDFEEVEGEWQGLPKRYAGPFTARFTTYINVTCGDAKKAKYQFMLESGEKAILYINDKQVSTEDKPVDIELKKGQHLVRVEYFCNTKETHGLKLFYRGPETMPKVEDGEEMPEGAGKILVPPTATCYYALPSCAQPKGEPLMKHDKAVHTVLWSEDDSRIASVGGAGKIHFWDPPTGRYVDSTDVGGKITTAAGGKDKIVRCSVRGLGTSRGAAGESCRSSRLFLFVPEHVCFWGVKGWGGCYRHHSARTNSRKLQGGVSFQEGLLFVCPAIFACAQWSGTRHRHAAEHSIRPVRMNRCIILHCMLKALAMDDDDRAS